MAAGTAVNLAITARDWEAIVGAGFPFTDPDLLDMLQQLAAFYKAAVTKPLQGDTITIPTTEVIVVKIATILYFNAARNTFKDNGGNAMNRVMTVLRAANNVADNYINTSLAAFDTTNGDAATQVKKLGRSIIMSKQYDNQ